MRIGIQWTLDRPTDWTWIDSSEWRVQPRAPSPDGHIPNGQPGWIHGLNVQGVVFSGDRYGVEHIDSETIRVYVWNDDPADFLPTEEFVDVWTFQTLAPDPRLGGAINTRQSRKLYAVRDGLAWLNQTRFGLVSGENIFDFDQLPRFDGVRIHGLRVPDELHEAHKAARSHPSWREWIEGLDPALIIGGRVPCQRDLGKYSIPDGTKTYYHNATNLATGLHNADHENELGTSAAGASTEVASIKKNQEEFAFVGTTPTNEPNLGSWPTGTYRYQIDAVATVGANITYGLLTIGSKAGHFARVDSGLSSEVDTKTQTDSAYSGTGLKLASTGSVSWSGSTQSDRFEVCLVAGNTHTKDAQDLSLQLGEADDYADGPWTDPTSPTGHFVGFQF